MNGAIIMLLGFSLQMVALGRTHPEYPVAISRIAIDLDGNSTSHQDTGWPWLLQTCCTALRFLWKPGAKDYNQCFITDSSQLEPTSYFWWKSVQKDFPVKQEARCTFKAQIWLVLNLRHRTSEGSQLVGCSSTEEKQSRKKLSLATAG